MRLKIQLFGWFHFFYFAFYAHYLRCKGPIRRYKFRSSRTCRLMVWIFSRYRVKVLLSYLLLSDILITISIKFQLFRNSFWLVIKITSNFALTFLSLLFLWRVISDIILFFNEICDFDGIRWWINRRWIYMNW